jgi:adenylylsulfate kinase-like enzyme
VVTGHTPAGKATVASDMEIDAIELPLVVLSLNSDTIRSNLDTETA